MAAHLVPKCWSHQSPNKGVWFSMGLDLSLLSFDDTIIQPTNAQTMLLFTTDKILKLLFCEAVLKSLGDLKILMSQLISPAGHSTECRARHLPQCCVKKSIFCPKIVPCPGCTSSTGRKGVVYLTTGVVDGVMVGQNSSM